ncbi:ATP-dependent helicase HrpA [Sulfuritortus calidifontis]|uniref:ATP-dependent helicase HrpA n=1 Tax=Sulfuritortus calidifontis TaxID=1914471 RepID=A0A4R3JS68_9PROT|nr:ATP-dependent RNA helicase HrpA [Sulfuritortus calidifontis]TCS70009.1 ATP-dependent helicase HrpA [Sulfuritortus calidifontis]
MTPKLPGPLEFPEHLPVCAKRDAIAAAIAAHQVVICCGETGSGKTTQLPKIALLAGRGATARIGMTQPRRIAARSVAGRIAEEMKSRLGDFVGYQVRFHDQVGPNTRIKLMTDGILLAETQSDPEFRAYDTIILDEAHERSLNIDFLLGYLKTLLPRRPELKLIISSATLEAERFAEYFGGATVIEVSGRTYPVELRYRPPGEVAAPTRPGVPPPQPSPASGGESGRGREEEPETDFTQALLDAVDELAREGPGDVLVFLPGEREIREAQEALRKHHPPGTEILPLYARLSVAEQERVFQSHAARRIVLATNVAETSLTVPGIRYVVDTGLARVKRYSLRNKIEQLKIEKIAQASANQRAGRCGRVAAGVCIRLYDEADFLSRPRYTTPELLRSSLAGVILRMKSLGLPEIEVFPFLDAPEPKRVRDGYQLLHELNAIDAANRLTKLGQQLAQLPLDPKIGRMLIAAHEKACLAEVLVIAAALTSQDPRERPMEQAQAADAKHQRFSDENSDFVSLLNLWRHINQLDAHRKSNKQFRDQLKREFISYLRVREWRDVHNQLSTLVKEMGWRVNEQAADHASLHQALLPGLLGNLGFLTEDNVYLGARDMKFLIHPSSGVKKKPKWLMAAEIVETRRIYARTVARIEPAWIEHAARHLLKVSYAEPHWEKRPAHVAAAMRATLYGLPVVVGRKVHYGPIDPALCREIFIRAALVEGDYDTRAPFFAHNQKLLKEIEDLAHRARNPRLIPDEQSLYDWFDARVPEGIHNGRDFEAWRREAETKSPRLLFLERAALLKERGADTAEFPRELDLSGVRFALSYKFEPGQPDDGVTLLVPLAALNQVPAERCTWLVPGLLEEKIAALIKSLPQLLRRNFVPVPEFARAAAEALEPTAAPLSEALARFLHQRTGVAVPRDAWREDALPGHLRMNFRVLDEANRILGEGRDLAALRQKLGSQASRQLQQSTSQLERDSVGRWDFGDLPEQVEVPQGPRTIAAFPALLEVDGKVELRFADSARAARERHRRGVCRLLWLSFPDLLRQTEKDLAPRLKPACLHYGLLGRDLSCEGLLRDVLYSAARACLPLDPAELRNQTAFESAAQAARPKLAEAARESARLAAECLSHAHNLNQVLARPNPAREAMADLQSQLKGLVFPHFVAVLEPQRLAHLPRYLRGIEKRLEKLAKNPARDAQNMRTLMPLLTAWQTRQRRLEAAGGSTPEMADFRWRLEELRISLFAQELKTPEPVSAKRLEKLWQEIVAGRP